MYAVDMANIIGWSSAAILLATLLLQVRAQWKSRSDVGVSPWLFVGQLVTSAGFIAYSAMKKDVVFVVTNSLIALVAIAGQVVYWRLSHKKATMRRGR
jgi:MtN3 and saliva related transmembrane protein